MTGTKISYEPLSNTLQSLFGPKKKPFIHGGAALIYAALTHSQCYMQAAYEAKEVSVHEFMC